MKGNESREPYFELKKMMQEKDRTLDDWFPPLLEQGRILRAALSHDIGTRQLPFLG